MTQDTDITTPGLSFVRGFVYSFVGTFALSIVVGSLYVA